MLSFATDFPVRRDRRVSDFLASIKRWILESPHTSFSATHLAALETEMEARPPKGSESVRLLSYTEDDDEAAAIRYVTGDDELAWNTEAVFSREGSDCWVSIRVSSESRLPKRELPKAKKPVLIRTLLQDLGGGEDGRLRVSQEPQRLDNVDIDVAAELILGKTNTRLPVVYVSAGFNCDYLVDVDRLAKQLSGLAHVVVEPNRAFSLRLKYEVNSENVFGGTIGLYWPQGGGRRAFFMGPQHESPGAIARAVAAELRSALNNRRALARCTWATVQEAVARRALAHLKAAGSKELTLYVEEFDKEIAAKTEQLADAEAEALRLQAEVRRLESQACARQGRVLRSGSEQDLYPDEISSVVLSVLQEAITRVPEDSRRLHVLEDLVAANALPDQAAVYRDRLKALLRGTRGVDAKVARGLRDLGFELTGDGKHYKMVFRNDDRYTFTLAKSASDYRSGLNAAGTIARLLFK